MVTYPNDEYQCPVTGVVVPKDVTANLEWRVKVLEPCEGNGPDAERRREWVKAVCARSPVVAVNLLFWTYLVNQVMPDGSEVAAEQPWRPFVTWPVQDEAIVDISHSIDHRQPIMLWKSREMGASWLVLAEFARRLLFVGGKFLVMSRAYELVENGDDSDSLFWKLRSLISPEFLPKWLVGGIKDLKANLYNKWNEGQVAGRSTTSSQGAGGRRDAALLDEFAHVENAKKLDTTLADTAKCRIYTSTPLAGSYFNKLRFAKKVPCIELPWFRSPTKAAGLRYFKNEDGAWELTSEWDQIQRAKRPPWDYAENVAMSERGSAEEYFPSGMLADVIRKWVAPPKKCGELSFDKSRSPKDISVALRKRVWETTRFVQGDPHNSDWRFWCDLPLDRDTGLARPPQDTLYIIGADLAKGTGASNTAFAVYDAKTREKVAEFSSPKVMPSDAARLLVASAYWFGGTMDPMLIWEQNGPGLEVGMEIMQMGYPRIYWMQVLTQGDQPKTKRPGYHNRGTNRKYLYGRYREMLLWKQNIINRSKDAIEQCDQYIVEDNGNITASTLLDEKTGAREAHADMVTADALCAWVLDEQAQIAPTMKPRYLPEMSLAAELQREAVEKREREQHAWILEY